MFVLALQLQPTRLALRTCVAVILLLCMHGRLHTAAYTHGYGCGIATHSRKRGRANASRWSITNVAAAEHCGFVCVKEGGVEYSELTNENLLLILQEKTTDEQVNTLAFKCLGYRYDTAQDSWSNTLVFPRWKKMYAQPQDLINVRRVYEREVDQPVKTASQALTKTIPPKYKRAVFDFLGPLGWKGWAMDTLTPNRTRRAQVVTWILYFREALFNKTWDEIVTESARDIAQAPLLDSMEPSTKAYYKNRLDVDGDD